MIRFTRTLATRLRRLALPPYLALGARTAAADAWTRLDRALAAPDGADRVTRHRELSQENVRLSVTLIGQQGRGALERIVTARDGTPGEPAGAIHIALAVAESLGHTP